MIINEIKLEVGCTVKFRCGGKAVVRAIICSNQLYFQEGSIDNHLWHDNGSFYGNGDEYFLDIIEIIPPAFDWKDVNAGMAFKNTGKELRFYLCEDFTKSGFGLIMLDINYKLDRSDKRALTRAPQYDIGVINHD